jgi:hypothetical protein
MLVAKSEKLIVSSHQCMPNGRLQTAGKKTSSDVYSQTRLHPNQVVALQGSEVVVCVDQQTLNLASAIIGPGVVLLSH